MGVYLASPAAPLGFTYSPQLLVQSTLIPFLLLKCQVSSHLRAFPLAVPFTQNALPPNLSMAPSFSPFTSLREPFPAKETPWHFPLPHPVLFPLQEINHTWHHMKLCYLLVGFLSPPPREGWEFSVFFHTQPPAPSTQRSLSVYSCLPLPSPSALALFFSVKCIPFQQV